MLVEADGKRQVQLELDKTLLKDLHSSIRKKNRTLKKTQAELGRRCMSKTRRFTRDGHFRRRRNDGPLVLAAYA